MEGLWWGPRGPQPGWPSSGKSWPFSCSGVPGASDGCCWTPGETRHSLGRERKQRLPLGACGAPCCPVLCPPGPQQPRACPLPPTLPRSGRPPWRPDEGRSRPVGTRSSWRSLAGSLGGVCPGGQAWRSPRCLSTCPQHHGPRASCRGSAGSAQTSSKGPSPSPGPCRGGSSRSRTCSLAATGHGEGLACIPPCRAPVPLPQALRSPQGGPLMQSGQGPPPPGEGHPDRPP